MLGEWWVVQTRPQYEKSFAHECRASNRDYYLPLLEHTIIRQQRHFRRQVPAFPLYVFLNGDASDRYFAGGSDCTARILDWKDQAGLSRELEMIEQAFANDPMFHDLDTVTLGMRCRVKQGHPLAGKDGYFDAVNQKGHAIVGLTLLGTSTPTEIDKIWLEPA